MSAFQIKDAVRGVFRPLVCFYAESGCGKTYSALLLARGFVGPAGKIVLADTEAGRGREYADCIPGGYKVIDFEAPFSPARCIEMVDAVEDYGAAIGILDSGSHEWEGAGGVCDMAAEIEVKSGKGLHTWKKPKLEHQRLITRLQQSKIPWIICVRAKYKTRQIKNNGKTEIVKDDYASPIQAEDFIFECNAHMEILHDHSLRITKASKITGMNKCFPETGPITSKHGELLAAWCAAPKGPGTAKPLTESPTTKALQKKLWDMTADKHEGMPERLDQWLWDEALMEETEQRKTLTDTRLQAIIKKAQLLLAPMDVTP
jgi:hypothetical protein